MSPGTPVSEILRTGALDGEEKRALEQTYRALFTAALDEQRFQDAYDFRSGRIKKGFVLTDPHQGNVALEKTTAGVRVDLFDPGQFETVNAHEAKLSCN
jgi:hypothetical protein